MDVSEYEAKIAALERENRILKQRILRSEANRVMLEEALETHSRALKVRNMELEESQEQIRQSEAKYRDLAFHDTLTGLPNRTYFRERLDQAIARARYSHVLLALFFIDLDMFKPVNDTYGHETGDKLLIEIGTRLKECVRNKDTVARIGGDEFAVLLEDLWSKDNAKKMAERILNNIERPFMVSKESIKVTASIGASLFPDDGRNADTLFQNADAAMYCIKNRGRNGYEFYENKT